MTTRPTSSYLSYSLGVVASVACASSLIGVMLLVGTPATPAHAAGVRDHDFVGAERCRSCHTAAFDTWAAGPHARAFASLTETDKKDASCLSCHAMVPKDLDVSLTAIQCETCHGAGRYYSSLYAMRDEMLRAELGLMTPNAKTCARCHTESSPSLIPFDVDKAMERIRHWPLRALNKEDK